ncbi:MAG: L,D-transpeptidase family protein [Porphyrobacter sp.]|nr:L,D-transpeptidase family protein [Porphyrobacter sp.]
MVKRNQYFSAVRTGIWRAVLPMALAASASLPAYAQGAGSLQLHSLIVEQAKGDMLAFYTHRDGQVWIKNGQLDPAAHSLLKLVETAEFDGLDPAALGAPELANAIALAEQDASPANLAKAEVLLSHTLATYAAAVSNTGNNSMFYEHDVLKPVEPAAHTVLDAAAAAPSLTDYVSHMQWMHPLYGQLRQKLMVQPDAATMMVPAKASLNRVRSLPAPPWARHVVIDIASARLFMYEGGQVVDSMKVVVGKADTQTPIMAGYIRYATLNPYWNVPANLVQKTISKNVLDQGVTYLRTRGYEVISEFGPNAQVLDPNSVDWQAIRNGSVEQPVRQKPSAANAMGKVKYEFPNPMGIYLHDTPDKKLMLESARQFSNGCVRLEDAARFGRWLFQGSLPTVGPSPEQRVDLAEPVPIYITYLTVQPSGDQLAVGPDPYARDRTDMPALARLP